MKLLSVLKQNQKKAFLIWIPLSIGLSATVLAEGDLSDAEIKERLAAMKWEPQYTTMDAFVDLLPSLLVLTIVSAICWLIYRSRFRILSEWRESYTIRRWSFWYIAWLVAVPMAMTFRNAFEGEYLSEGIGFTLALAFIPSTCVCLAKYFYVKHIQ